MSRRVAVVGGGIAGLSAAWELVTGDSGDTAEVTVLDAAPRTGGKIRTTEFMGLAVDEGADAFLRRVPWGLDLCAELGLTDGLVAPAERSAYIWSNGALRPLPARHVLGVPVDLDDLAATGLVDDVGMDQAREAFATPARLAPGEDCSVGDLVRRAVGQSTLDNIVAPLIGGINAGDADTMSAGALTPQLVAAARRPEGMVAALHEQLDRAGSSNEPVFAALPDGTQRLIETLTAELTARGATIRTDAAVTALGPQGAGLTVTVGDDHLDVDAVILAVPAPVAGGLVSASCPDAESALTGIDYASVALLTLGFDRSAMPRPLDASGFLVPRSAGLLMTACSWASTKWEHLGGGDSVVLRASAGAMGDERIAGLDDDQLVAAVLADLATTMGPMPTPEEVRVSHWPRSLPQYAVGHLETAAGVRDQLARDLPGVELAGAGLDGVGIPACIHSGREAARRLA